MVTIFSRRRNHCVHTYIYMQLPYIVLTYKVVGTKHLKTRIKQSISQTRLIQQDSFALALRGNTDCGPHSYHARPDLTEANGRVTWYGYPSSPPAQTRPIRRDIGVRSPGQDHLPSTALSFFVCGQ